jgi:hypothetical protein
MKAHDVIMYLKPGTIVVKDRTVILVVDQGAGDTGLINPYNGKEAHYSAWFTPDDDIELYADLEDWILAHYDKRKEERTN